MLALAAASNENPAYSKQGLCVLACFFRTWVLIMVVLFRSARNSWLLMSECICRWADEDCGCAAWIPVFPSRKQWFQALEKLLRSVERVVHMVCWGVLMRGRPHAVVDCTSGRQTLICADCRQVQQAVCHVPETTLRWFQFRSSWMQPPGEECTVFPKCGGGRCLYPPLVASGAICGQPFWKLDDCIQAKVPFFVFLSASKACSCLTFVSSTHQIDLFLLKWVFWNSGAVLRDIFIFKYLRYLLFLFFTSSMVNDETQSPPSTGRLNWNQGSLLSYLQGDLYS